MELCEKSCRRHLNTISRVSRMVGNLTRDYGLGWSGETSISGLYEGFPSYAEFQTTLDHHIPPLLQNSSFYTTHTVGRLGLALVDYIFRVAPGHI